MAINQGLFTANRQDWETPMDLFSRLGNTYGWPELDVCATPENAKCDKFFTPYQDGLKQSWAINDPYKTIAWCNPPYGREIAKWVQKAHEERLNNVTTIALLPARVDTAWFHTYCIDRHVEFLRGRVKFIGAKWNAPFPSMVVVFEATKLLDPVIK